MFGKRSVAILAAALIVEQGGTAVVCDARIPRGPQSSSARSAQSDAQGRIRATSDLVVLAVNVKDASGNLVAGLQENDFRVYDDGVEQSLSVFTSESFPLSLVVLVDDDLPRGVAEQMTRSLRAIVGGVGSDDEVMACRYDLSFYPGPSFARDVDTLWNELKEV